MKKKETEAIMSLFADTLKKLYTWTDTEIPESFDPDTEARRLFDAIQACGNADRYVRTK